MGKSRLKVYILLYVFGCLVVFVFVHVRFEEVNRVRSAYIVYCTLDIMGNWVTPSETIHEIAQNCAD